MSYYDSYTRSKVRSLEGKFRILEAKVEETNRLLRELLARYEEDNPRKDSQPL